MLGECAEFGARCIHFCMGAAARGTLSRPAAGHRSYATCLRASGRRPYVLRLAARARSSPCSELSVRPQKRHGVEQAQMLPCEQQPPGGRIELESNLACMRGAVFSTFVAARGV